LPTLYGGATRETTRTDFTRGQVCTDLIAAVDPVNEKHHIGGVDIF